MEKEIPLLTAEEQRVLGTLIEKSRTTPDYYPMTVNALAAGCNQKTSRKPVVDFEEATVVEVLNSLKGQDLVATAIGGGSRVVKYKHNFLTLYQVSDAALAVLCALLLRGPQTPGELNTNSSRMHEFMSLESVQETLNTLMKSEKPFVKELTRQPGQKETRYIHLFGDARVRVDEQLAEEPARQQVDDLETRVKVLEMELVEVKETLERLMKELMG